MVLSLFMPYYHFWLWYSSGCYGIPSIYYGIFLWFLWYTYVLPLMDYVFHHRLILQSH
jgi:hypothetical protein